MRTGLLVTAVALGVLLAWSEPGHAARLFYFAETAAQTHGGSPTDGPDTPPYFGNGIFQLN